MNTAIITLCGQGARIARRLAAKLGDCRVYVHDAVAEPIDAERFPAVLPLTEKIFGRYKRLVYIAPCGVVVRAIAPCVRSKLTDPAVVVVDVGGRHAVSLLSGHEGGANQLALEVGNALGAEPVISTTTEAVKTLIIGIGCRRGAKTESIEGAIRGAVEKVGAALEDVRLLASAGLKADEAGLLQAARGLGLSLRFIPADEILSTAKHFRPSAFVAEKVKLPAVAEPSALLAGRRTQLILPKTIINGVTVAVARENCL
ncbi:MAG: cobalamin biosynthesis protein [Chthoniobacteraceae bacterium]|nr:cobalamin biosynthesis protein [Chthoniobacteraceae bacterium]